MNTASNLTWKERQRQQTAENWSIAHDDTHDNGELGIAALCYEQTPSERDLPGGDINMQVTMPNNWPWDEDWWKPSPDDRVKELIKAGGLYRAEIDRLMRRLHKVHALIENELVNPDMALKYGR